MPKSKWVFVLLACLLLAGGGFYWKQQAGETPAAIGRSTVSRTAAETPAVLLASEPGNGADETKEDMEDFVSEATEQETETSEWIFATEPLMVNINTADGAELEKLPGIGPGKAQAIIAYRQEHGPFQSIEELMLVPGIKEGTFAKLKDYVTV